MSSPGEAANPSPLRMLRAGLIEVEVSAEELRRDPTGESWLPEDLKGLVQGSQECRYELAEFVAMELELFDDSVGPTDAIFTARVMEELPDVERTDTWRRTCILAAFHALAIGVAYLVLWPMLQSGEFTALLDRFHGWLDDGMAIAGTGLIGVAVLFAIALPWLAAGRSHRARA